ncbi:MAG: phage holin family protein [Candidatus Levybacteria bacterium]|nr:phage holin family protein [Candidatus Levybacteria bacterium]
MAILVNWIVSGMVIFSIAYILPGTTVSSFTTALVVALILGIINALLKPILLILTLPINILTLGLFTFVLNALLILLVSNIVEGFRVDGFLAALVFGIVLSIVNTLLHNFLPGKYV